MSNQLPSDLHIQLLKKQLPKTMSEIAHMQNTPYCQAVGSLIHLTAGTQSNITLPTSFVVQFNANPGWEHWEVVKWIYKYLSGIKTLMLTFRTQTRGLVRYIDGDGDGAMQEH